MSPKKTIEELRREYDAAPMSAMLSPPVVAAGLGVSVRTLESWRADGRGPAFVRHAQNMVRYRKAECERHLVTKEAS